MKNNGMTVIAAVAAMTVAGAAALSACAEGERSWTNPLFEGWYADPQIRRYGDNWWVFPTGSGPFAKQPGFDVFSSKDLKTWTRHQRVLTTNDVAVSSSQVHCKMP